MHTDLADLFTLGECKYVTDPSFSNMMLTYDKEGGPNSSFVRAQQAHADT